MLRCSSQHRVFHEGVGYKRDRDGDKVQQQIQSRDVKEYSGKSYDQKKSDSRSGFEVSF